MTEGRFCWFGDIRGGEVDLNVAGEAVRAEWLKSSEIRPGVELGEYIIMPNHLHAIVTLPGEEWEAKGQPRYDRLGRRVVSRSLGALMRGFKGAATRRVSHLRRVDEPGGGLWQRNYHEHIVRDEPDRDRIERYIRANPARWQFDPENIEGQPDDWELSFWASLDP